MVRSMPPRRSAPRAGDAVEKGTECPPIRLLTSAGAYIGSPRPAAAFWEATVEPLFAAIGGASGGFLKKASQDEQTRWRDRVREALGRLGPVSHEGNSSGVTLVDAEWWPMSGSGLELPVVRVPLDGVSGWWIAGRKEGE
jgi:hypothetical protein